MAEAASPAARLRKLAAAELALLAREFEKARHGRDTAVHRARKTLQRLRSLLRLARDVDPVWFGRCDDQFRRLRRRLGRLRDAAVRVEHVEDMLKGELLPAERARIEVALQQLREQRAAVWQGLPDGFWDQLLQAFGRAQAGFAEWPLEAITPRHVERALKRARRRVLRALREALGDTRRSLRHDLRRLLRRYGAMRKAASQILRRRDAQANRLVDAARELGIEGDLWLTATALQHASNAADTRTLRSALEKRRRQLCRLHDGDLIALRRTALVRPARPLRAASAARQDAVAG